MRLGGRPDRDEDGFGFLCRPCAVAYERKAPIGKRRSNGFRKIRLENRELSSPQTLDFRPVNVSRDNAVTHFSEAGRGH